MRREFHNIDHAYAYLVGSIIRVDGEPVYIMNVRGRKPSYTIEYYPIKLHAIGGLADPNAFKSIKLSDESVDMEPMPLGFSWTNLVDITGYETNLTVYISRTPSRNWKIGLYGRNVQIVKALSRNGDNLRRLWIPSKMLHDTVVGNYPKLDEALDHVRDRQGVVPFSRRFAVCGNALIYKTFLEPVGRVDEKTCEVELEERFSFLKEVLAEDMA